MRASTPTFAKLQCELKAPASRIVLANHVSVVPVASHELVSQIRQILSAFWQVGVVSRICARCRPPSSAGIFHWAAIDPMRRRRRNSIAHSRTSARARISDCFHCSAHCFFHCLPLLLCQRLFCRRRKALHCNWRAFSIADRLYFSRKNLHPCLRRPVCRSAGFSVGHEGARGRRFRDA